MLRKLFKYDFEATGKIFLILYGIIALLSIFGKILFTLVPEGLENGPLLSVLVPTYILLIIGLVFGFEIFLVVRFYRSLFTDEGYLYHTLPVKPWQHILSKLFTNVLLSLCGVLVIILCGLILLAGSPMNAIIEHSGEISSAFEFFFGISPAQMIFFLALALPITECHSFLMYFASIALGQILIPRHKVLGAFAAYIIYYIVIQMITSIPLFAYAFSTVDDILIDNGFETSMGWVTDFYHFTYFFSLALSVLCAVIFFFITNLIMKKKLNLD